MWSEDCVLLGAPERPLCEMIWQPEPQNDKRNHTCKIRKENFRKIKQLYKVLRAGTERVPHSWSNTVKENEVVSERWAEGFHYFTKKYRIWPYFKYMGGKWGT